MNRTPRHPQPGERGTTACAPGVRSRVGGQALVLFVTLLGVLCLGVILLFNTGQVVNKKVRLTNAVDAAAYSVAVEQARVLNFAAYMNRGRVANEVAIAQMVSMFSWVNMVHTHVGLFRTIFDVLQNIPIIGVVFAVLRNAYFAVEQVMEGGRRSALMTGFNAAITAIDRLDQFYARAAADTIQASATGEGAALAQEVLVRNDPSATFEPAGLHLLLAGQLGEAAKHFIRRYEIGDGKRSPGMDRYRNVVMESRDLLTRNRNDVLESPLDRAIPELPLPNVPGINIELDFDASIETHGGTDMVEYDRWAAMDTLAWIYRFSITAEVDPCPIVECALVRKEVFGYSQDIAMGWGGAMAVPDADGRKFRSGMHGGNGWDARYEIATSQHYRPYNGVFDAAGNASLFGGMLGIGGLGTSSWLAERDPAVRMFKPTWGDGENDDEYLVKHEGLQDYHDIAPGKAAKPGKDADDGLVYTVYAGSAHRQDHAERGRTSEDIPGLGAGSLEMPGEARDGKYTAIASAQVYFQRPMHLPEFARRVIGRERAHLLPGGEKGSLFSPYWQARLVETPPAVHALLGIATP